MKYKLSRNRISLTNYENPPYFAKAHINVYLLTKYVNAPLFFSQKLT